MDRCVYYKRCPCYVDVVAFGRGDGRCIHISINCQLAQVYQMQEKFAWPTPKGEGDEVSSS